ncbi:Acyl-coenzyme A thioesterase 12 [Ceratobasidium sp. 370]|nr:Acyl-coenzyme A thioesterase 12 [Ceratobasidium sp. 370]
MVISGSSELGWQNKALLLSVVALSVAYRRGWTPSTLRRLISPPSGAKQEAKQEPISVPPPKPVSASTVHMSWRVTPDVTDEHGRLYAGEMLKIIDVAAGVAARRHTDLNCVTISLDRVVLVREIRSGNIIHIDACINRAWGSSIEAGVRVLLEDFDTGELVYCCHAYLTFVALAPAPSSHPGPPPSLRLGNASPNAPKPPRRKAVVAPIQPQTLIEKKRYLFAGRRRAMRTTRPPEDFSALRSIVSRMVPSHAKRQSASESGSSSTPASSGAASPREHALTPAEKRQARELRSLELELLADALEAHDPHVHVDAGDVVRADVGVYGPDAPVVPLADLNHILEKRKRGRRPTWVGLQPRLSWTAPAPTFDLKHPLSTSPSFHAQHHVVELPAADTLSPSDVFRPRKLQGATEGPEGEPTSGFDIPRMVSIQDTLACTMQIVMPQHANSVGVLFGGQLMEWMERTAVLAAHRLKRECAWVTAGWVCFAAGGVRDGLMMDGLEFREAVATGEVLTFRAIVTRVWTSSVEVYVCSHADVRRSYPPAPGGPQPSPGPAFRFTNEAFLTLVALTPTPMVASPSSTPAVENSQHVFIDRRPTMLPTTAAPVRIGAAIIVPPGEEEEDAVLAAVIQSAEKRRAERLEMRELLLR